MGERGRRAHRQVERAATRRVHVRERVEEEDDVGVALRMLVVHPQPATARARPPVDAPHAVAGLPLAHVGELDPVAFCTRDLVADEHLRLERRQQCAQRLDARVHAQRRLPAEPGLPRVEAETVARTNENRPDRERAPALAADRHREHARLARREHDRPRIAHLRTELAGQRQKHVDAPAAVRRAQLERGLDVLALERTLAGEQERRLDLRVASERGGCDGRERERGGERDELDPAGREPRDQGERREPRVRGETRRDDAGSSGGLQSVLGGRRRHRLERLGDDVLAADALYPQLRPQRQPVRERRDGDRLHVLRHDEVAAGERGLRARELQEREAAARARADGEPPGGARRRDEVDDVALDRLGRRAPARASAASRRASARRRPGKAAPRPRRARAGARASRSRARGSDSRRRSGSGTGRAAPRAAGRCPRTRSGSGSRAR